MNEKCRHKKMYKIDRMENGKMNDHSSYMYNCRRSLCYAVQGHSPKSCIFDIAAGGDDMIM